MCIVFTHDPLHTRLWGCLGPSSCPEEGGKNQRHQLAPAEVSRGSGEPAPQGWSSGVSSTVTFSLWGTPWPQGSRGSSPLPPLLLPPKYSGHSLLGQDSHSSPTSPCVVVCDPKPTLCSDIPRTPGTQKKAVLRPQIYYKVGRMHSGTIRGKDTGGGWTNLVQGPSVLPLP